MVPLLLDENLDPSLQLALLQRNPKLIVLRVDDFGAPKSGTKDPQLLNWIEENGYLLVSNDRNSLQQHLTEHLDRGRHIPGILWLKKSATYGEVSEALELISLVLDSGRDLEFSDCIRVVPLT